MARFNPIKKKRGVIAAIVIGIGAVLYARRGRAAAPTTRACTVDPFKWKPELVRAQVMSRHAIAIAGAAAGGPRLSALDIAADVADALYPAGTWPPGPNAPANEKCLWDQILGITEEVLGPQINWPEIINPLVNFGRDAQPGKFLQIEYQKPPTIWSHSAIKSKPGILDVILTNANVPNTRANRKALFRAIVCGPWNDAVLGIEGKGKTGIAMYSPSHNRGISLYPVHADNLQRMLSGRPPRRRVTSPKAPSGGRLPLIWIPDIERGVPSVVIKSWPDGRSAINPPAEILEMGLDNVPPGSYGCDPWRQNAAPLQY